MNDKMELEEELKEIKEKIQKFEDKYNCEIEFGKITHKSIDSNCTFNTYHLKAIQPEICIGEVF